VPLGALFSTPFIFRQAGLGVDDIVHEQCQVGAAMTGAADLCLWHAEIPCWNSPTPVIAAPTWHCSMNNVVNTQACLPEYNGVLNSAPNGTFGVRAPRGAGKCIPLPPRMTGITLGYKF